MERTIQTVNVEITICAVHGHMSKLRNFRVICRNYISLADSPKLEIFDFGAIDASNSLHKSIRFITAGVSPFKYILFCFSFFCCRYFIGVFFGFWGKVLGSVCDFMFCFIWSHGRKRVTLKTGWPTVLEFLEFLVLF